MRPYPAARRPRPSQRGAATLVVVLALFFIMALAAAYATRNMVFEQRITNNTQRASQAFEAAEAGIDWAVTMLGQGRVDAACLPVNNPAADTFRQRYVAQSPQGVFSVPVALQTLRPSCVMGVAGFACSCPGAGQPTALPAGVDGPTFQLRFLAEPGAAQPGVLRVESRGCNARGGRCDPTGGQPTDAEATVSALLALSPLLADPPHAALTVRGDLDLGGGAASLANTAEGSSGVALAIGGTLSNSSSLQLAGPPGSAAGSTVLQGDATLASLTSQRLFVALFGVDRGSYMHQPALAPVSCSSDCSGALSAAATSSPGRVLWVAGNLSLNADVTLGTPAQPVLLVVEGDLSAAADLVVNGLVYLRGTRLTAAGTLTRIRGALVAENALEMTGAPVVVYDADVLAGLTRQGSLVRAPGGWRDFTPR